MEHIKTYFNMMNKILRRKSEGDLMYYLECISTPEQAMTVIKSLREDLVKMATEELTKEMNKQTYHNKEDLINRFAHIIEKQRWYPFWMWEYSDLEEWACSRAEDNGYGHLVDEDYDR